MKKTLLFLACAVGTAYGQITLDDTHFAGANETYIFSTLTDPSIDYTTSGANQTWDFSGLVATDQKDLITNPMSQASGLSALFFGTFAAPAYKATYFNSTNDLPLAQLTAALPITISDVSLFTKKTTTYVNSVGVEFVINGTGVGAKSDTIETRYELPLTYGDAYFSRGYTDLNMNPILDAQWRQHKTRNSNVDGWGNITTPFGSFSCLRIHHIITENDSVYLVLPIVGGTWLPLQVPVAHEYEWRSTSDKEAILRIRTNVILGQEAVTGIEFRDNYNGLGLEENSISLTAFPNPTTDVLNVSSNETVIEYIIIDAKGQIVRHEKNNQENTFSIGVTELASGSYVLLVNTSKGKRSIDFKK